VLLLAHTVNLLRGTALPNRRLLSWAWSGAATAAMQATVQGLGLVAGILVIRYLSPQQYAFYTIVTAGLGTMTVLTDSGVSSSVLALGGEVWQDRAQLGGVLASGLRLRRRFAYLALIVALPLLAWLLHRQGAAWGQSALISASIVPLFLATVTGHLLEAVPRLRQALLPLQTVQVVANAMRIALIAFSVTFWPIAVVASLVSAVPQWWANWRLRRVADRGADWRVRADPLVEKRILRQVRRTMPGAIHYSLSGQLTVWLIALFGGSSSVAAVGALGRLTMVLAILSAVFNTLAVPRFARIPPTDRSRIRRRYFQSQSLLIAVCAVPVFLLIEFPAPALAVLGPHYTGLHREVALMGIGSVAAIACGAAYTLGAARGIVAPPALSLPYTLAGQVILVAVMPLDTVRGVIWVGILSMLSQYLLHLAYFEWRHARSIERCSPPSQPTQRDRCA